MSTATPTTKQLAFQDWELGVFVHFGIRTFYEGHRDFDGQAMCPSMFNPTSLDCRQWAKSVRQAGGKYMVMTAKHHDGFSNWPTNFSSFSVKNSPWRAGQGDVVQEYTDACREHDLKIGLYYSPADGDAPVFDNEKAYDDFFINQISELLTGYGQIDMLWFDGCGSENHTYDWNRIITEIRKMQPDILIFNMGDPNYRWIGNESGLAPSTIKNETSEVKFSILRPEKDCVGETKWLPAECDLMMRDDNWFFSDADEHTVKTPEELFGIYQYSVGRGTNMLVNIGPNREGLFPEADVHSLQGMQALVKKHYSEPLVQLSEWGEEGPNHWSFTPKSPVLIKGLLAQENQREGQFIEGYSLDITPYKGDSIIDVVSGTTIGHKILRSFPVIRARKIHFKVTASKAVSLRNLDLF